MATLRFRRGSEFTSPSISEPFFNTDNNTLLIGTGSNTGDNITLVKLGENTGSIEFTGDITASNLNLSGDITARDFRGRDVRLSGNIFLGDEPADNIVTTGQFSGSLIPSSSEVYDLGSDVNKWGELHVSSAFIDNVNLPGSRIMSSSLGDYQDFDSISSSLDSRLDNLNLYTQSTDLRLDDLELTGSDHESRIDEIETTFSSSVDSRLDEIENTFSSSIDLRLDNLEFTGSNHEDRINLLESTGSNQESRIDDLELSQSLFDTTFSSSVDSRLDELEGPFSSSVNQQLESIHSYTSSLKNAIDVTGQNLTLFGDLIVEGTTTTINTQELIIEDSLLAIASGSTTSAQSDGAGFFISGANASILWNHPNQLLEFNTKISSSVGFKGDGSELVNISYSGINFGGTDIVSGSDQVTQSLDSRYLEINGDGVISGSDQVTQSLDLKYLEINGDGVISGSEQVTQSLDLRYEPIANGGNTLISSSLYESNEQGILTASINDNESYINLGLDTSSKPTFENINLPNLLPLPSASEFSAVLYSSSGEFTYSELGTSAYYNVSQSISEEDDNVIGTAGAMKRYIDEQFVEAGQISDVFTGDGLDGGGSSGSLTLTLDTGSQHFIDGVEGVIEPFSSSVSASLNELSQSSGYINYVTNSIEQLTGIEVADFDNDVAVTFTNGTLKFIFGTPTVPFSIVPSLSGFLTDRFNQVEDEYTINGNWNNGGYTLISASLYEDSTLLEEVGSGTSLSHIVTTSGSHTYRLEYTASSPLDGTIYETSTTVSGTLSKTNPSSPTLTPSETIQLGVSGNQIEQGATGSISFTSSSADPSNGWDLVEVTTNVSSPYLIEGSLTGSTSISIVATSSYESPIGDNNPDLSIETTTTRNYTKIRSLRYGSSTNTSFTEGDLANLALWDTTLGGSIGTIEKGTTNPSGQSVTITWSGDEYHYIVYDSSRSNLSNITTSGFGVLGSFTLTTVGQYKIYRTNTLQAGGAGSSITYDLT